MPLAETRKAIYDEILSTNFKAAYFTIQKALPHLNDDASIILNTSIAGSKGIAGTTVYSATKAALGSLASAIAAEVVWPRHPHRCCGSRSNRNAIFGRAASPEKAESFAKAVRMLTADEIRSERPEYPR